MRVFRTQIVSNVSVVQIQACNKIAPYNEAVSDLKTSTNRPQCIISPSTLTPPPLLPLHPL